MLLFDIFIVLEHKPQHSCLKTMPSSFSSKWPFC